MAKHKSFSPRIEWLDHRIVPSHLGPAQRSGEPAGEVRETRESRDADESTGRQGGRQEPCNQQQNCGRRSNPPPSNPPQGNPPPPGIGPGPQTNGVDGNPPGQPPPPPPAGGLPPPPAPDQADRRDADFGNRALPIEKIRDELEAEADPAQVPPEVVAALSSLLLTADDYSMSEGYGPEPPLAADEPESALPGQEKAETSAAKEDGLEQVPLFHSLPVGDAAFQQAIRDFWASGEALISDVLEAHESTDWTRWVVLLAGGGAALEVARQAVARRPNAWPSGLGIP